MNFKDLGVFGVFSFPQVANFLEDRVWNFVIEKTNTYNLYVLLYE